VPEEAKRDFIPSKSNTTPHPAKRLKSLVKLLEERKRNATVGDEEVNDLYNQLRMTARDVVQSMVKNLKKTGEYVDGMSFKDISKTDTSIQERYCLILEKKALDENKIDLHLCEEMWGAKLLISEVLKNKRLKSSSTTSSLASRSSAGPSLHQSMQNDQDEGQLTNVSVDNDDLIIDSEFRYRTSAICIVQRIFLFTYILNINSVVDQPLVVDQQWLASALQVQQGSPVAVASGINSSYSATLVSSCSSHHRKGRKRTIVVDSEEEHDGKETESSRVSHKMKGKPNLRKNNKSLS
jgi:hypothetical protein